MKVHQQKRKTVSSSGRLQGKVIDRYLDIKKEQKLCWLRCIFRSLLGVVLPLLIELQKSYSSISLLQVVAILWSILVYFLSHNCPTNTISLSSPLSWRLRIEARKTLKNLSNVNQTRRTHLGTWSSDTKFTIVLQKPHLLTFSHLMPYSKCK